MSRPLPLFALTLCCSIVFFLPSMARGQGPMIEGVVVDSTDGKVLAGATVVIVRDLDATRRGAIAKRDGSFSIGPVADGRYVLSVAFIGYRTVKRTIDVERSASLNLGRIALSNVGLTANEIVVTEQMITGRVSGDTVEMNAGAFKANKDASAEDLVQKMPGITVQDGRVQAQGEQVRQVLVDGRQFFGDDPNAALRNLPAEMIDKVQIFDQGSEQARFSGSADPNGAKTINIVTKKAMRNGQFGRLSGGVGDAGRYRVSAVVNAFEGTSRWTILAQSNNINEQNFSIDDIVGAMGGGGGGGRMGGMMRRFGGGMPGGTQAMRRFGGPMSDFLVDQQNGITQTHALGINYSDVWWNSVDAQASYFFNYSDNGATQDLLRQFIQPQAAGQTYTENTRNTSTNVNHRLRGRFEARLDSLNSIVFTPRATAQFNNGASLLNGTNTANGLPLSGTATDLENALDGFNVSGDILYRRAFDLPGRTFSLNLNLNVNSNVGDNLLTAINADAALVDTLFQRGNLDKNGWTIGPSITWTEPFDTVNSIALSANASREFRYSTRETFRPGAPNAPLDVLDTALTNTFESRYTTYSANPVFRHGTKDVGFEVGASFQQAILDNDQQFPSTQSLQRTFTNILPNASVRLNLADNASLRLFYRARTSPPTVDQLQSVVNNTNPIQLSAGNPDLRQDVSHNVFMRYASSDMASSTNFFAFFNASTTVDYVANDVLIADRDTVVRPGVVLPRGGQFTTTTNMDGYVQLRSFVGYGFPLALLSSNVNLNASIGWTRTPGLINGEQNIASAPNVGGGVTISSNISELVDFTISTQVTANQVRNSLRKDQDADYLNAFSRFRLQWQIAGGLFITADVTNTLTSGFTQDFNQSVWLVNGGLGYKFLENDRAEVRLTVNDALRQNTAISRNVSESFIDDIRANQLQRYALLSFSYNLRNFSGAGAAGRP